VIGRERRFDYIKRMFEQRKGIYFKFNEAADIVKRIAENKAGSLQRPEQVTEQRKAATDCIGEKERRSTRLVNPPLESTDFQVRIKRHRNSNQFTVPFEINHTFLQIFIAHMT
jgi:hypothetical protein